MTAPDLPLLVADALATRYGLPGTDPVPVHGGQNTVNFHATAKGRKVFVKTYPTGIDLGIEGQAIALSERAGAHGVPVAPVIRNRNGQVIDDAGRASFSVWEWVDGHVVTAPDMSRCAQAGAALGHIHTAFADLPATEDNRTAALSRWRITDVAGLTATIDHLLATIDTHHEQDWFDSVAAATLAERRIMLTHLPALTSQVSEELAVQVLHGDFSPVNLLYTPRGDLAAVLDFTPPRPDLVSYDLGRMAFYPHTVTGTDDWLNLARTFITAYLDTHPRIRAADVRACGRIALIQLLRSLYGVKQHYLEPGLDQAALDDFWVLRHRTARTLLENLNDTDRMLDDLSRHLR